MKTWLTIVAGVIVGAAMAIAVARQQNPAQGPLPPQAAALNPRPGLAANPNLDPALVAKVRAGQEAAAIAAGKQPNPGPARGQDRVPHPAPKPGDIPEMGIKELANFTYDPETGGGIPPDVKAFNGTQIRLRGFMLPLSQAETITDFALVPSLFSCCFGQPPGVEHTVIVRCPKDKAVPAVADEIVVEGKLKVEERREENFTISIFELDASSIKIAAPN